MLKFATKVDDVKEQQLYHPVPDHALDYHAGSSTSQSINTICTCSWQTSNKV